MTKSQRRIAHRFVLRTLIAAVAVFATFLGIWVALDASVYVDPSTVLAIIAAGLIADRLASTLIAPRRRRAS